MRVLIWAVLALFVYFLLTRLRTLAALVGLRRGLREETAVRIRASRVAVEMLLIGGVLGLWATRALNHGHLDWEVGGSGSPLHLQLDGTWFIAGAIGLVTAVGVLTAFAGSLAFAMGDELREQFPRSAVAQPYVLRLATMNPGVFFVARRRSPPVWLWTELRAAAFGLFTTLAIEVLGHELPVAGSGLSESFDEVSDEFDLEERLPLRGRAFNWSELRTYLAAITDAAPVGPSPLILPPLELPTGGRGLGLLFGIFGGAINTRRQTQCQTALASFDEREHITAILQSDPGPMSAAYLAGSLDGLLHQARGAVFDDLKGRLPRRRSRQLAKAYRRDGMDGAAAWMIRKLPSYPELLHHSVHAELDRQASLADSVLSDVQRLHKQ